MKQTLNLALKIGVHIKWGDFVLNIISCHSFNDLRKKIWKNSGCITFGGSKGSTSFLNFLLLNGSSEVIDDFVSLIHCNNIFKNIKLLEMHQNKLELLSRNFKPI